MIDVAFKDMADKQNKFSPTVCVLCGGEYRTPVLARHLAFYHLKLSQADVNLYYYRKYGAE